MADISIKLFVESTWFKMLSRGAMVIAAFLSAYIAANVYDTQSKVKGVEAVQAARAIDGEQFQTYVRGEIDDIQSVLRTQQGTLVMVQTDTATIRGILSEMRRQDIADNARDLAVGGAP